MYSSALPPEVLWCAILWCFWVDFRGVPFQGTTVGLAPVMAMCSDFQSGGVNMVSNC